MFRKFGLLCAVLALFSIAGGHWAVLQTVAWAEMLRDYTQRTGSVTAAVEQTFDGQHPCELCRQIAVAKQQEKAQDHPSVPGREKASKAEKSAKATATCDEPFRCAHQFISFSQPLIPYILSAREEQPPTPPPKLDAEA